METEFCETSGGAGRHVIWAELSCGTILFHCIQSSHLSPEPETMLLLTIMILLSKVHIKQMTEFMSKRQPNMIEYIEYGYSYQTFV